MTMLERLTENQIEQVLVDNIIGHLGCHADGVTYVVPISYAYDGQSVVAHSTEGMKIEMMRKNPNVCFQVDDMKDMGNWRSVVSWGSFEELVEEEDREKALNMLLNRNLPLVSSVTTHLGKTWPFTGNVKSIRGVVFRIRLEKKSGRFESTQEAPYFAV